MQPVAFVTAHQPETCNLSPDQHGLYRATESLAVHDDDQQTWNHTTMSLIVCSGCKKLLPGNARFCTKCGTTQESVTDRLRTALGPD